MDTLVPDRSTAAARAASMRLKDPAVNEVLTRRAVYESLLPLAAARVLELGCGAAESTREIATRAPGVTITALEVDVAQHQKNLAVADLPNVTFALGGAEAIPARDASFDVVLMFKSLHHVPIARLDAALAEIRRVLVPGGLAYFEEPVFDGDYNEVIRVYHDEEAVRGAAFAALRRAVASGAFELVTEKFFLTTRTFRNWDAFRRKVLEETHTTHQPTPLQWEIAEARFMRSMTPQGAMLTAPMRVDLLRKATVQR